MLAALEARDGRKLSEVLSRHLENKRETVKQAIRDGVGEAHGPGVAYD